MEPEHYFPSPALCSTKWWSTEMVAVVTGGNRGIGFALVKRLADMGINVVLTARDNQKGEAAMENLRAQGLAQNIHFLLLDVSDPASITEFASSFREKFGPNLDILVNNAGVSFNGLNENSVDHAESVIKTNFYGPKLLIEALLPLFRTSSSSSSIRRILNVSSRLGSLNKIRNAEMRRLLECDELSEEDVEGVVRMFLSDVREGTWKSKGWPSYWTEYAVSKLALNAYSKVLAKRYNNSYGLSVNCFCPGFTQTSMTNGKGNHSAEEAADFAATLALLPPRHLPTGKFFLLRKNSSFLGAASKL